MPHLVTDWDTFEDYAEHVRIGVWVEFDNIDEKRELRIVAGRLAFKGVYDSMKDPELLRARTFCKFKGFIHPEGQVDEERFLSAP